MGLILPAEITQVSIDTDNEYAEHFPLGLISFEEYQLGNGDKFALYWPIGHEQSEPIVTEFWHDEGSIKPAFSSLALFLQLASELDEEDGDYPDHPDYQQDSASPQACLIEARHLLQSGELIQSIHFLEKAIQRLPEYTEAAALLTNQYIRMEQYDDACKMAVQTLISPPSFGVNQQIDRICFWLSTQKKESAFLKEDPIWQRRAELSSLPKGGDKFNNIYALLSESIEIYIENKQIIQALTLMQTYREYMNAETFSFQERNHFNSQEFYLRKIELSYLLPNGPRILR
ncbi:tetratricopeptide repeat protein [Xenorhabdus szentirmaii]|uniref:Tetratricopeptide repeat protein n=2 Tax=Xenorhabdus szentirmaii TaxID=290112 RepID=W1IXK1_9GAMM|nr:MULTISPECIES: tetratricopeptide repeat protein [Xenorhabdus]MBD2822304.1 tetratricopeptide repeat protein [Xenorhabdus sp. 42]PHM33045.1 hypothetical protein Xsze_03798 [Xenorhabdus szentirmaii DSM 16338]PHM40631.1 hypothetical protein Xszus_00303 [Xenorhabdus szentirmaii]CDL82548.1 conserved hypothetical protein [Xenorhabdus szentirmaii DSM 16338]